MKKNLKDKKSLNIAMLGHSIFKNDCSDIEIVLVNDGSSDDIGGGGLSQYF